VQTGSAFEPLASIKAAMNSLNLSAVEAHAFLPPPGVAKRFGAVVEPYLADAYALARWLTSNHADSQDVVQDACLRALHGIGNFADGDARSWVLTIVRRTAYDWLSRNRPEAIVFTEDWEGLEGAQLPKRDAVTAESCLIDREDEAQLQKAIAALPAHYRQTLVLRHVQDLTYREIAESTGVSIGTVMSRLSRARRHLTERLKHRETAINFERTHVSKGGRW
jgi:RNA polymerase sigma factor (sigma-70 family)